MKPETCPECGEPFFAGQRYYAAPTKLHVICRKYRDERLRGGEAMHALNELRALLGNGAGKE